MQFSNAEKRHLPKVEQTKDRQISKVDEPTKAVKRQDDSKVRLSDAHNIAILDIEGEC